ncbi:hypothetical protein GCM10023116_03880 [Kistimonas scapharcae]|uniref:Uncharacterized protein n=1 Tax=Kistimonas scapharcae TaxID=1036133 RepID=A0ABP8UXR9_9GAMM
MKNLDEIKAAVDAGKKVCWMSELYEVRKDPLGRYLIVCTDNHYTTGLTDINGVLHENPADFFIAETTDE